LPRGCSSTSPIGISGVTPAHAPPLPLIAMASRAELTEVAMGSSLELSMTSGALSETLETGPRIRPLSPSALVNAPSSPPQPTPDAAPHLSLAPSNLMGRHIGSSSRPMWEEHSVLQSMSPSVDAAEVPAAPPPMPLRSPPFQDGSTAQAGSTSVSNPAPMPQDTLQVDVGSSLLAEMLSPEVTGQEPRDVKVDGQWKAESSASKPPQNASPASSPALEIANTRVRGRPPAVGLLAPLKR